MAEALEKDTEWERMAVTVFGLTLLFVRLMFAVMASYSRREGLVAERQDDPDLAEARRKSAATLVGSGVTIVIGLVLPVLAIGFSFALAIFLVVLFRAVAKELFGRRHSP